MSEVKQQVNLVNQMMIRMGRSYQCFLLYKALVYTKNTDIHTLKVTERNNFIFKRHIDFFVPVQDSLLTKTIIDLNIFFDKSFINYSYKDLEKQYIARYRNGDLAHDGKYKKAHELKINHIETLFATAQNIFNLITHDLENSYTDFSIYNETLAMDDTNLLFTELQYGYEKFVEILKAEEMQDLNYSR